jgi:hypothetical protein
MEREFDIRNAHDVSNIYIHNNFFGRRFSLKIESVVTFLTSASSAKQYGVMSEKKKKLH